MSRKQKKEKEPKDEKLKEAYVRIIKRESKVKWIIHEKCKTSK